MSKTIKMQINVNYKVEGEFIICDNTDALQLILGTKAVSGAHHLYGIEKTNDGKYKVPLKTIKKRIEELEKRLERTTESLRIMKQIGGEVR